MDGYWANVLATSKAKKARNNFIRQKIAKRKAAEKAATGIFRGSYRDYLKSPQWAKKVRKARKHYGYKCTVCAAKERLEVHHRHYRTLFHESMADLDLLCHGCHGNEHEKDGKGMDPLTREYLSLNL